MRVYLILLTLVLSVGLGIGCRKQAEPNAGASDQKVVKDSAPASTGKSDLIGRFHFIGSRQVLADTNSTRLKELTDTPATAALLDQTLDKLATAPFRLFETRIDEKTNTQAVLVRPLCEDLLRAESYVEMRDATLPTPEVMLAIRLDNSRAELWRTNLATILSSWTGITTRDFETNGIKGWELKKHHVPNVIRFLRAGDWVLFGWGKDELLLQPGLLERIKSQGRPVTEARDYLLDAWVDWPSLALQHTNLASYQLPKTRITVAAAKDFLRPKVVMQFAEPLNLRLPAWQVPTNIIRDPLISFTAVRGITPWLKQLKSIQQLHLDTMPEQYFVWAMQQIPLETCLAAPVENGTNFMKELASRLVPTANADMQKHRVGQVEWNTNKNRISFSGLPLVSPYLELVSTAEGDYIRGGLFPSPPRTNQMPAELLTQLGANTNLVYYDWEITEERLPQWKNLSGLMWIASAEFIPKPDVPTQKWLDELAPKLGNCGTMGTVTAPNEVTLVRNSPIGLTAFELTMLKRWLDSPKFPWEFHYVREHSLPLKKQVAPPPPL